ncbi:MAG: type II toxin-antitoxin system RelE/ParE family toxin [Sphingomonadaceae bacterium]
MANFRVSAIAGQRLDEIFAYTERNWGDAQAEAYIQGLFECFTRIAKREVVWRAVPAEFGVDGFYARHEHHYVYWRILSDETVGIVTVLHERMHQMDRFRGDLPA